MSFESLGSQEEQKPKAEQLEPLRREEGEQVDDEKDLDVKHGGGEESDGLSDEENPDLDEEL